MAGQAGLFDLDERYAALSRSGDPLERLAAVVDFEMLRADLDAALARSDRSKGWPPMDAAMMFKVLWLPPANPIWDSHERLSMGICGMRTGISFEVSPADRRRLEALLRDRNTAQKHVWRAEIVSLSAGGAGTIEIMRRTAKSKTCVWRWQERFMQEGVEGLLRDKTRPSRIPPLGAHAAQRVVGLTLKDPPTETTHSTAAMMAGQTGLSESSVRRIWRAHGLQPHRVRRFKLSNDPDFVTKLRDVVGLYVDPPAHAVGYRWMKSRKFRRLTALSRACR